MTDSLRDQLLGLGFKPAPKPERKPEARPERRPDPRPGARHAEGRPTGKPGGRPGQGGRPGNSAPRPSQPKPAQAGPAQARPARSREEMDLGKAYAIRAQKEKEERIEAERVKQEEARLRREAKAKVDELLKDKSLNDPAADIARHFPYGGKIKRIHVNAQQLKALNAGELGVLQQNGRYLLVTAALLAEAEALFPACVALKVDPDAPAGEDPYADPQYQVPDDLVW
ncbi:DUF2058 family protein [Pseudoxanthomonas gei]|uniref:DUF2058 family protein n=1 Tax=Pseudoxanthomonas gei TaxID=1383030 RepID=A0ABX0AAU2_9GAMM|nr:DUF2058 family protein [Pseudoxanthomonas gei]NDK37275.1 DUF2058 family protein [Pseudoxanthomonas gei]